MDVWGSIYRDHHRGDLHPHVIERDDGQMDRMRSAGEYFKAPRSELERRHLDALEGPVLDLGAGVGSYALYLEARGLQVTAVDSSAGAIEVCQLRGCNDARVMDVRSLELEPGRYAAFVMMGNTLGNQQTPETLPLLLRTLAVAARPGARLLCSTLDPLDTSDPKHLQYHQRNRDQGQPPGLAVIRLRYRDMIDEWVRLWMPTQGELEHAVAASGWTIVEETASGPTRVRLLELA